MMMGNGDYLLLLSALKGSAVRVGVQHWSQHYEATSASNQLVQAGCDHLDRDIRAIRHDA
eukprot:4721023-Amphidinium_carterae.2